MLRLNSYSRFFTVSQCLIGSCLSCLIPPDPYICNAFHVLFNTVDEYGDG